MLSVADLPLWFRLDSIIKCGKKLVVHIILDRYEVILGLDTSPFTQQGSMALQEGYSLQCTKMHLNLVLYQLLVGLCCTNKKKAPDTSRFVVPSLVTLDTAAEPSGYGVRFGLHLLYFPW